MANKSVLVLYDPAQAGMTVHVRGTHFQKMLAERGWRMDFLAYSPPSNDSPRRKWRELGIALRARRFGIVYLLKISSLSLVRLLRDSGTRVVFDLTDSLWREEVGGTIWGDLDRIVAESDAVFTCNAYDTEYGARLNPRTVCLPPYADVTRFQQVRTERPSRADGVVRIGWVGSPSTLPAIKNVAAPLDRVAQRHPGIELRVVGCPDAGRLPAFPHLPVSLGPATYDQEDMIQEVLDLDIGIFPVPLDVDDYRVRGPMKAFVYMAGSVPCICHRAGECEQLIEDGRNGLLAGSPEEWETQLERLVLDPALRRTIGRAGLETVRSSYSLEAAGNRLEAALSSVLREPARRSALSAHARLLIHLARVGAQTGSYFITHRGTRSRYAAPPREGQNRVGP